MFSQDEDEELLTSFDFYSSTFVWFEDRRTQINNYVLIGRLIVLFGL